MPIHARVRFEQEGSRLTAVEIVRSRHSPVVISLQGALLALGIVVCSYEVLSNAEGLVERIVLRREDGGDVEGSLSEATKATILPIAFEEPPLSRPAQAQAS